MDSKIKEGKIAAALKEDWITQFSELPEDKIEGMKKIIENTPSVDFGEHSIDTSDKDKPDEGKIDEATGDVIVGEDLDAKVKERMGKFNEDYETASNKLVEMGVI